MHSILYSRRKTRNSKNSLPPPRSTFTTGSHQLPKRIPEPLPPRANMSPRIPRHRALTCGQITPARPRRERLPALIKPCLRHRRGRQKRLLHFRILRQDPHQAGVVAIHDSTVTPLPGRPMNSLVRDIGGVRKVDAKVSQRLKVEASGTIRSSLKHDNLNSPPSRLVRLRGERHTIEAKETVRNGKAVDLDGLRHLNHFNVHG